MDLIAYNLEQKIRQEGPLAQRMRPESLEQFVGQEQILGRGKPLRTLVEADRLVSLLFYGPPGTGKTSLARIIATATRAAFTRLNAVSAGVKEVREVIREAEENWSLHSRRTILFIDEIHRFNKAQQDALLAAVEQGTVIFIGATTENPFFYLTGPLLSRIRLFVFEALQREEITQLINAALADAEKGLGKFAFTLDQEAQDYLADKSSGDARAALNALEMAALTALAEQKKSETAEPGDEDFRSGSAANGHGREAAGSGLENSACAPHDAMLETEVAGAGLETEKPGARVNEAGLETETSKARVNEAGLETIESETGPAGLGAEPAAPGAKLTEPAEKSDVARGDFLLTLDAVREAMQQRMLTYDRQGDSHYDMASALIKSIRGSDPDAALYWMARMLKGGEDPLFIARRLMISAAEDIGNADPQALPLAVAAAQAVQMIGLPEGRIPLAQAVTYLAGAPKSNASYLAIGQAMHYVEDEENDRVPPHLRDSSYRGAGRLGHGEGYKYPHDYPGHYIDQDYLPPALAGKKFYRPTQQGREKEIASYLERLDRSKEERKPER